MQQLQFSYDSHQEKEPRRSSQSVILHCASEMSNEQDETISKIPLLTSKANPCDGPAFQERLKEELCSLITVGYIFLLLQIVC